MNKNGSIETLISTREIGQRIEELGADITRDYRGKNLVVIGVLKGSFMFMADLVRQIQIPVRCDFLRVSSYDQDRSTGAVRMEFDLTQSIADQDVLLIEDIVDTGNTLKYLVRHIETHKPKSFKICSLLFKDVAGGLREKIDYLGFTVPNRYVVGYGLDSEGLYRSLPYVGAFKV